PLQRGSPGQACQLRNHSQISDGGHAGGVRIVFRHVTDETPNLADVFLNVETKHAYGSARWRMKTQERAQQRRLACAIGSEQTNGAARETPGQAVQYRPSR